MLVSASSSSPVVYNLPSSGAVTPSNAAAYKSASSNNVSATAAPTTPLASQGDTGDMFAQFSAAMQAMLVQMQSIASNTTDAGATDQFGTTPGMSQTPGTAGPSQVAVDQSEGRTHHHHHHHAEQAAGAASADLSASGAPSSADAAVSSDFANLIADLTSGIGGSPAAASSTSATATATPQDDLTKLMASIQTAFGTPAVAGTTTTATDTAAPVSASSGSGSATAAASLHRLRQDLMQGLMQANKAYPQSI
jgi:hypothetical protein